MASEAINGFSIASKLLSNGEGGHLSFGLGFIDIRFYKVRFCEFAPAFFLLRGASGLIYGPFKFAGCIARGVVATVASPSKSTLGLGVIIRVREMPLGTAMLLL